MGRSSPFSPKEPPCGRSPPARAPNTGRRPPPAQHGRASAPELCESVECPKALVSGGHKCIAEAHGTPEKPFLSTFTTRLLTLCGAVIYSKTSLHGPFPRLRLKVSWLDDFSFSRSGKANSSQTPGKYTQSQPIWKLLTRPMIREGCEPARRRRAFLIKIGRRIECPRH